MAESFEEFSQRGKIEIIAHILRKYMNTKGVRVYMRYCVGCKMVLVRDREPCGVNCEVCHNSWCEECAKSLGDDILEFCRCGACVCPWCVKRRDEHRNCLECFHCFLRGQSE